MKAPPAIEVIYQTRKYFPIQWKLSHRLANLIWSRDGLLKFGSNNER